MGAAILTGDLSDFRAAISGEFGASGRINFRRRKAIFTSQKLKTKYFRNGFGADGICELQVLYSEVLLWHHHKQEPWIKQS